MMMTIQNHGRQITQMRCLNILEPLEFEKMLKKRTDFAYRISEKWQKHGLTALISPFWHHTAPKWSDVGDLGTAGEYSFIWNITGFPCGVMPVTTVSATEQTFDDVYKDKYTRLFNSTCEGSEGLPVCV